MAEKENISSKDIKNDVNYDISIGELPTMDEDGFQPLGDVDRYQIVKELGTGGFGTVFLAKDTVAGIRVALKALPPEISAIPGELENVRNNFALISKLLHPNIAGLLHLHKVGEVDAAAEKLLRISNRGYLVVMEYIAGSTLGDWRKQFNGKKIPFDKAVAICGKVAAALDYAHENNIIHRDVKPSNVMITPDEKVKVMDFGLAAEIRSSMSRVSQERFDTSGTRPYMAPEQWTGKRQSAATDQYALAAMFYELVSGEVPFHSVFETGDTVLMMNVVEQKQPEPLSELNKKQNAALLQALSKKPEERFASCGDFIKGISGGKVKTQKSGSNGKKLLAAIVLIALGAGGVWYGLDTYHKYTQAQAEAARLAQLQKEQQRQISEALSSARSLYKQNKYGEASSALQTVFNLDGKNAEARQLQENIARAADLADVSPIRSEAEVIWESAQKINGTDGFYQDIKQLKVLFKTAWTLFEKEDYGSALKRYQNVISQCQALLKLDGERNAAKTARFDSGDAKRIAEQFSASRDAKALYQNAERLAGNAADAMKKRDFASAAKLYKSAGNYYTKAKAYAKGYQTVIPLKQRYEEQLKAVSSSDLQKYGGTVWSRVSLAAMKAESELNRGEWQTAVEAYEKALSSLPEAISNARGGVELQSKKEKAKKEFPSVMKNAGELFAKAEELGTRSLEASKLCMLALFKISKFLIEYGNCLDINDKSELKQLQAKITAYKRRIITNCPKVNTNWLVPDLGAELVYIRPGTFMLGSTQEEREWAAGPEGQGKAEFYNDEGDSPRRAEIKHGFWMGRTEVTVGQWRRFIEATGYKTDAEKSGKAFCFSQTENKWCFRNGKNWRDPDYSYPVKDNFPVTCVSWNDVTAFCQWLTKKEREANRLPDDLEYRLPTEAEWEYACRGGRSGTKFWWGDDWTDAQDRANVASTDPINSKGAYWTLGKWKDGWAYVAPVDYYGYKGRNGFGLADMLGNVWEWCLDPSWTNGAKAEYVKSDIAQMRVLRGGSFYYSPGYMRCANRNRDPRSRPVAFCGFRFVCGIVR
ncbi:MAG: SUMF1/EgtB/PvdO family nonheme iron enzyme [Victivallaceae bacterium]